MQAHSNRARLLGGLLIALVLVLAFPTLLTAEPQTSRRDSVRSPDRTDAGDWTGTWFFQTHKEKWALWIRMTDGAPELKFQFQNYDQGENFITDWISVSRYAADNKKGLFRLNFDRRDADVIAGDWFWQLGTPEVDRSVRTETATFQMYRAARGRQLVLRLDDFERVYEGSKVYRLAAQQAWTFHKASRRHARWKELPF